jgi:hypothetical protein
LVQPEGSWSRFDRSGLKALIYRDPATADWFPASALV